MNLKEAAAEVMAKCRENGAGGTEQAQIMALAEETGEFVGAMRRWRGLARRRGTEAEAQAELADVIISAYAMASVMDWDVDALVESKLGKIMSRGWKEALPTTPAESQVKRFACANCSYASSNSNTLKQHQRATGHAAAQSEDT